tara:strand:+ start:163 stop:354 length:192 start_codon:yes stop_codon:yes gene_type:complete
MRNKMVENTRETRRKLAEMVVASMDMESLVTFAQASVQVMYEDSPGYFEEDAENYDLEGVLAK